MKAIGVGVKTLRFRNVISVLVAGLAALFATASHVLALDIIIGVASSDEKLRKNFGNVSLLADLRGADDVNPQDVLSAARADYSTFIAVLYANGYYGGIISIKLDGREAVDVSSIALPNKFETARVRIDPGPIFTFSEAAIGPLASGESPLEGFARGRVAQSGVIIESSDKAVSAWRDQAHAKARVVSQDVTADHRRSRISATIRIDPGPRLRFGNLQIAKNGGVRDSRVRAIADLPTGRPFSPEELQDASVRLRRSGAFSSVVLSEAESPGPDGTLDIIASLEAQKLRRIGFGAEIASLEGLTLSFFWLHRNLLGGAERLRFDAEISGLGGDSGGEDYLLGVRYERPATFSSETDLYLLARLEQQDEPEFRERRVRLEGGTLHRFSDVLTLEAGVAYQFSDVDDALGSRQLSHLLFPATLTYDDREDALDPKGGYYFELEAQPFVGLDGNSDSGARIYADARTYRSFGEAQGVTLAARAQIGSVIGPSVDAIPPGLLFFSGGSGTVRGQPFQSLGVDLPSGDQIGGRSFAALSLEVRADVADQWSIVGFADGGFVGEDSFGSGDGDSHAGAGFGARYKTGIGPIRFDIGTPLDGDAGSDFEIYIGIGQAF